jgi:hypothetical protein
MGISAGQGIGSIKAGVCTSSTRPSNPYEGQMIYETDTDRVLFWNGSAWAYSATPQSSEIGTWETWTPSQRAETGTWTTSVLDFARYGRIQKLVFGQLYFRITAFGTGGGIALFNLPVTAKQGASSIVGGGFESLLTAKGTYAYLLSTTVAGIRFSDGSLTAGANNGLSINFSYEAA